jgi:hypothetical protein
VNLTTCKARKPITALGQVPLSKSVPLLVRRRGSPVATGINAFYHERSGGKFRSSSKERRQVPSLAVSNAESFEQRDESLASKPFEKTLDE